MKLTLVRDTLVSSTLTSTAYDLCIVFNEHFCLRRIEVDRNQGEMLTGLSFIRVGILQGIHFTSSEL